MTTPANVPPRRGFLKEGASRSSRSSRLHRLGEPHSGQTAALTGNRFLQCQQGTTSFVTAMSEHPPPSARWQTRIGSPMASPKGAEK